MKPASPTPAPGASIPPPSSSTTGLNRRHQPAAQPLAFTESSIRSVARTLVWAGLFQMDSPVDGLKLLRDGTFFDRAQVELRNLFAMTWSARAKVGWLVQGSWRTTS